MDIAHPIVLTSRASFEAVNDAATCEACKRRDRWPFTDGEHIDHPLCTNPDGCRCVVVRTPVLASGERQPVIQVRCHPHLRQWAELWFNGEIIIDETLSPERVEVIPLPYAKDIKVTIGFVNPATVS